MSKENLQEWICRTCSFYGKGQIPEKCPTCGGTNFDIIQKHGFIPLLSEVLVKTAPMPLWYSHWSGLHKVAFDIRQELADERGLGLIFHQYESTRRGVERVWGRISAKYLLDPKKVGASEYLSAICAGVNLKIRGSKPIESLILCRCPKTRFLVYYAPFYGNYMELLIYIDSGEDVDGASVTHLPRSRVDESTRDWKRLAEQLPLEIWIKEA